MPRLFKRSSTISSSAGSPDGAAALHHRRRQGPDQSNPPNLRSCRGNPALSGPQGRNIMERLPKSLHASVRPVLRQAWELDDADKAEKLLRNLAQRLERDWSGVSGSILEGIDEILTVTRLRLPKELRRSLACTNIIENVMGTVRRVCRNVKRWRSASMAMRWTAAAMQEAAKGFRRLKAHKQLPALRGSASDQTLGPRRACSPSQRSLTSISAATASQCSTKSGTSAHHIRCLYGAY